MKVTIEITTRQSKKEILKHLNHNLSVWKKFEAIDDYKIDITE